MEEDRADRRTQKTRAELRVSSPVHSQKSVGGARKTRTSSATAAIRAEMRPQSAPLHASFLLHERK
eukprot:scaffold6750_cov160-Amphora_coffeaeformis.AAC.4